MNLLILVLNSVAASLTGVLMPGAMTAATLAAGVQRPHAGAWVAVGHAVVEVPLILLLMWVSVFLNSVPARIFLGLVGGAYLAWLGVMGLWGLRKPMEARAGQQIAGPGSNPAAQDVREESDASRRGWSPAAQDSPAPAASAPADAPRPAGRHPFVIGVVLSGGNPGFLLWWGTAGLLIATALMRNGWLALGLFAVIHWLCDLVWLEALTLAAFKGTRLLGAKWHQGVLGACSAALIVFAGLFLYDAAAMLLARLAHT